MNVLSDKMSRKKQQTKNAKVVKIENEESKHSAH